MAIQQVILAVLAGLGTNQAMNITGSTATINGIPYWIPPDFVEPIGNSPVIQKLQDFAAAAGGFLPLTVVDSDFGSDPVKAASWTFARYQNQDDVWQDEFTKVIFAPIRAGESSKIFPTSSCEESRSSCFLFEDVRNIFGQEISEGPYFFSAVGLHRAYRLYRDHQMAFSESTYTNPVGIHSVLPAGLAGQSLAIAVPSRLYFKKTAEKPLAGTRLGVKDIFDISGVKTGNGNRQWYNLYPNANFTALPVQRLIDAGAIVVGKMKTTQFANMEYGTSDWIDYHCPFNPRGDGQQDPNSSSAGPGAGIAAYPWLDIAIGTDTGGSIRGPARVQGLYALRPSHGLVAMTHTTPLAPEFDTPALIVREPALLRDAAAIISGQSCNNISRGYPRQILAVDLPPNLSIESTAAVNKFMGGLINFLGIQNQTTYNIDSVWQNSRPKTAPESLTTLLNTTYTNLITQRQVHLVRDRFYNDYASKYNGRRPFVNPVPLARWAYGERLPENAAVEAIKEKTIFMDWFKQHVLTTDDRACSSSILVYCAPPVVVYRNTYRSPPRVPFGFAPRYWSVMSETPDLVITVGETSYHSDITNHEEYLPVTLNLMVAKGCDLMLLNLVVDLVDAGILRNVKTGASSIYGGEILK